MIPLVKELFEGHYLIHKHQPHIGTYMGGCHFPAQYVTSLHSILVGEQLLNRQFPALSKTVMRKKKRWLHLQYHILLSATLELSLDQDTYRSDIRDMNFALNFALCLQNLNS